MTPQVQGPLFKRFFRARGPAQGAGPGPTIAHGIVAQERREHRRVQ